MNTDADNLRREQAAAIDRSELSTKTVAELATIVRERKIASDAAQVTYDRLLAERQKAAEDSKETDAALQRANTALTIAAETGRSVAA